MGQVNESVIQVTQGTRGGECEGWAAWFLSELFSQNCAMQLAIHLFEMDDFEMDALAIQGLMAGTYIAIKDA